MLSPRDRHIFTEKKRSVKNMEGGQFEPFRGWVVRSVLGGQFGPI